MEERVALAELFGAGLGAEVAVGTISVFAFRAGAKVEMTDVVASPPDRCSLL